MSATDIDVGLRALEVFDMRIFVTGASGWIGSAVVPELLQAGHQVTGLARSDASAQALAQAGADVERGTIDDLDLLAKAATAADGVIHLAFKHDIAFTGDFAGAASADRAAITTFGDALAGSGKPFVIASGTLMVAAPGQVATERDGLESGAADAHGAGPSMRAENGLRTLALADRGVRSAVLRLPPTVHGDGDNGFMAALAGLAREHGNAAYVGDGANRWPAVHRSDAARLFRLAVEKAPPSSVLHAVGDEGVPIRAIAEVFSKHLDVPVAPITPEEAPARFSWLAGFIGIDAPASSAITQELLDWHPTGPTLLEDLDQGHYFTPRS
jgi:nucleoside-diphosphate-sugar epimerase